MKNVTISMEVVHKSEYWISQLIIVHAHISDYRTLAGSLPCRTDQLAYVLQRGDTMGKVIAIANQKGGVGVRP